MTHPALTIALLAVLAAACSGNGDSSALLGAPDAELDLPVDFPPDFPLYPGANLLAATRDESSALTGLRVTWSTPAAVENVAAFYSGEFEEGPWQAPGATDIGTALVWTAESDEDERRAIISVSVTTQGLTQVVVLLGDFGEGEGPGEPTSFRMLEHTRSAR